jgi:vancomycin permeability regulator SanA
VRFLRFLRRHPLLASIAGLLLAGVLVVSATAYAVWRAAHTDDSSRVDHADLIIVLGAAQYSGRPSPVFEGRLDQAKILYQGGFAPLVLVVGGGRSGDVTTEGAAGAAWLVANGLPSDAVSADPVGSDTYASLQAAARFMDARGLHSAFLVSDPWHNLRVRRMASDLGIHAFVSATWHSAAKSQWTPLDGYARETFAYLYYRVFHR